MPSAPLDRITAALARIEAASARRAAAVDRLAERHSALRTRMADAIAALDVIISDTESVAESAENEIVEDATDDSDTGGGDGDMALETRTGDMNDG